MNTIEVNEQIPVKGEYDVIVAGGGVAGVAAALACARRGKKVLLIEKTICLGGLATSGLVNLFVPMCNGRGKQIIKGMAEEFLRLSVKHGYDTIPDEWKNGEPGEGAKTRYLTRFSVPIFIIELTKLMNDNGVKLLFDTVISKPVMESGHCRGLIVENKSGREFYSAKQVIDTTGDADVLYRAGVPTVQGKNYYTFYAYGANAETCKKAYETNDMANLPKVYFGGKADLYGGNHPEGMKYFTGTDAEDISDYIIRNHTEMLKNIADDDRKARDIFEIPTMCQFRTTRHIDGEYTVKEDDTYKHFEDSVGAINDFDRKDYLFEIPYRAMIKKGFDNLITAGRCVAGEGYAWDVLRVIPPAIISGQAAGEAAVLAIESEKPIYDVDIKELQLRLEKADVMIHFDDSLIPSENENTGERFETDHI